MNLPDVSFSLGSYALNGNPKLVPDTAGDWLIVLTRKDGEEA
ncbi:hypothetical protein [Oscillibacter sp. GMB15532]